MISIRVTSIGDTTPVRLSGMLAEFERGISDWTPAWPKVIARFRRQEERLFTSQGGSGAHGRWAPLDPDYAKRKARLFARRPILYLSGALRDSLTLPGATGSIIQYDNLSLFIGTQIQSEDGYPYASAHMAGLGLPQRRPVDPTEKDVSEWVSEIWRYFESVKVKSGFRGRLAGAMR